MSQLIPNNPMTLGPLLRLGESIRLLATGRRAGGAVAKWDEREESSVTVFHDGKPVDEASGPPMTVDELRLAAHQEGWAIEQILIGLRVLEFRSYFFRPKNECFYEVPVSLRYGVQRTTCGGSL